MKSQYTRDVGVDMITALQKEGVFFPFIQFVKQQDELAVCFRGNASEMGVVTIYRHNHCVWDLQFGDKGPEVTISLDHARFIEDWDSRIVRKLFEIGFVPKDKRLSELSYDELAERKMLAKRTQSKDKYGKIKYSYNAIELCAYITDDYNATKTLIKESYRLITEMQNSYFSTDDKTVHIEEFVIVDPRSKKEKREKRPHNHIKDYYFRENSDAIQIDTNLNMYASFQPCTEKHVQQELFLLNHKLKDGIFVYDLEFVQPPKPGIKLKSNNKPDMFGIRFDEEGKMVAICMIEVKSTKTALTQGSGLKAHLDGMEEYIHDSLMEDRKKEACRILNQYYKLGLYGTKEEYTEDKFMSLKHEIIFVFSNELSGDSVVEKGKTVNDILSGYDKYDKIDYGKWSERLTVLKKEYEVK